MGSRGYCTLCVCSLLISNFCSVYSECGWVALVTLSFWWRCKIWCTVVQPWDPVRVCMCVQWFHYHHDILWVLVNIVIYLRAWFGDETKWAKPRICHQTSFLPWGWGQCMRFPVIVENGILRNSKWKMWASAWTVHITVVKQSGDWGTVCSADES